ncbi:MAG: M90 family metallopeptidase [Microthrixaceae bacterium]
MFGQRRHERERREFVAAGFLPEWRRRIEDDFAHWRRFSPSMRSSVEHLAMGLLVDLAFEPTRDFELDDAMCAFIAAQAAVLLVGLDQPSFGTTRTVIVSPTNVTLMGEHSQVEGVVSDAPYEVEGLAEFSGEVLLAWDAVLDGARRGSGNVVFHEFAHQLDMLDGVVDGTPPLADPHLARRWVDACTRAFDRVAHGDGGRSLDAYAGVNPGEFFAVATESFFDDSVRLRSEHPDLYGVLAAYYGQDPAREWAPAAAR